MASALPPGADLNLIPAGYPPPGVTPNFINPPSLAPATIGVFSTLITLAILAIVARITFNFGSTRRLGSDDICAIFALVFSIAQSSIVLSISRTERHQWDIPLAWYDATYFKKVYAQNFLAWPAIFLAKVAILLLYRRIFRVKAYMRISIWIGIVWALLTYLPNPFVISYYCAPHIGEQWDLTVGIRCGDPLKWEIASAAMSIMLDIFILILPIPVIMGLHLTRRTRVGVLFVFLTATFAVVCAVLTLVYRVQIFLDHTGDAAWKTAQLYICNGAENYTAIIVGCVPGISSFFKIYVAESKLYTSIADSLLSRKNGRSTNSSKKSAGSLSTSFRTKGRYGPATFGGLPYQNDPGFGDSSTSHLQGYHELKGGKVITNVSRMDGHHHHNSFGEEGGITRSVGIEQSSSHSTIAS